MTLLKYELRTVMVGKGTKHTVHDTFCHSIPHGAQWRPLKVHQWLHPQGWVFHVRVVCASHVTVLETVTTSRCCRIHAVCCHI